MQRIIIGFAKKILADNIGLIIDPIFMPTASVNFVDGVTGMVGFGMRIFLDFSGYSDIAIGSALLFGYRFPENFNWPYAARSPREFWNRWHMSLSRWIRDYVFLPLSFAARDRPALGPVWLLVAMALCGLWHGAAWTMVLWGVWHGILLVLNQGPLRKFFPPSEEEGGNPPLLWRIAGVAVTWTAVNAGWVLFRVQSVHQAVTFFKSILTPHGGLRTSVLRENSVLVIMVMFVGLSLLTVMRRPAMVLMGVRPGPEEPKPKANWTIVLRPAIYVAIITVIIVFDPESTSFIYFQF